MIDGNRRTDLLEKPSRPALGANLLLAAITVVGHGSSDGDKRAFAGERTSGASNVGGSIVSEEVGKAETTVGA